MKNSRLRLLLACLILLSLIWLVWPDREHSQKNLNASPDAKSERTHVDLNLSDTEKYNTHDKKQRKAPSRVESTNDQGLKRLDSLILNKTLSNREVAEQLHMIASDKGMSEEIRSQALGHGVLLDLPVFTNLAADTQLPVEMAEELLMHVINENRDPALQITTYKNFLNHPSSEIRDEARQLLAFILEDDFEEADQAKLVQMADAKLKQLEAQKLAEE